MPRNKPLSLEHQAKQHMAQASLASLPSPNANAILQAAQEQADQLLEPRTTGSLNLRVLQRHLPEARRIISVAPFAAVYEFSASGAWEKTGVEGTLFVIALDGEPSPVEGQDDTPDESYNDEDDDDEDELKRFAVVVLNRKALDNFAVELLQADAVEVSDGFVIVSTPANSAPLLPGSNSARDDASGEPTINGLWIFSDTAAATGEDGTVALGPDDNDARALNARVIEECAELADAARRRSKARIARIQAMERQRHHAQFTAPQGYDPHGHYHHPQHTHQQQHHMPPPQQYMHEHSRHAWPPDGHGPPGMLSHQQQQPPQMMLQHPVRPFASPPLQQHQSPYSPWGPSVPQPQYQYHGQPHPQQQQQYQSQQGDDVINSLFSRARMDAGMPGSSGFL